MTKPHKYQVYPEFMDLEKYVWEGLNRIGDTIPKIREDGKTVPNNPIQEPTQDKPIWHTKSKLDDFVAGQLGLRLEDYGIDKSKNPLYKAIANEVANLRRTNVLIDWKRGETRDTGMGLWRLDKTKLQNHVYRHVRREMKNKNYHSQGEMCVVFVRQKQNAFRTELLQEYGKCAFCGFKIKEYMIGAHIVPYSVMRVEEPKNAMNPINGLLLCRFCDVAFEQGSITLEEDLGIVISDYLQEQRASLVKSWLDLIPGELIIKKNPQYRPAQKYLKWKKSLLSAVKGR